MSGELNGWMVGSVNEGVRCKCKYERAEENILSCLQKCVKENV